MTRDELLEIAKPYGKRITVGEEISVTNNATNYHYFTMVIDDVCVCASSKSWQDCANKLPEFKIEKELKIAELRERLQALEGDVP